MVVAYRLMEVAVLNEVAKSGISAFRAAEFPELPWKCTMTGLCWLESA